MVVKIIKDFWKVKNGYFRIQEVRNIRRFSIKFYLKSEFMFAWIEFYSLDRSEIHDTIDKKRACMSALIPAAMILIFCAAMFADENPLFVASDLDFVVTNYAIDKGYPWVYDAELSDGYNVAYCAGNSYKMIRGVSIIAITVTGTGGLSFNYNISIRGDWICLWIVL